MKKGFSFVELLVSVTIIGILATVGIVTYTEFVKSSRDAKRKGDLEQIRGALEMYRSKNSSYPVSITFGGDICDPAPGGCTSGTYLKTIPKDPKSTLNYYYTSDGLTYTLGAYLEQGSTSDCGTNCGGVICNYCMGPYGQL